MKMYSRICGVSVLTFLAFVCRPVSADSVMRLDVFHKVLEKYKLEGNASQLPEAKLNEYVDAVVDRFSCEINGTAVPGLETETALKTCQEKLCLDTKQIIQLAGGNSATGLTEEQFHSASLVMLHFLSRGKHPCGATLRPSAGALTLTSIRTKVVNSLSSGGQLSGNSLKTFLTGLNKLYEGKEHHHDKDNDNHKDDASHSRRKRSGDDDHDHEEGGKPLVVEAKCLSADAVLYYLKAESKTNMSAADTIDDLATVVVYLMSQGSAIEDSCRLLPLAGDFVTSLVTKLTGHPDNMTQAGLQTLMEKLQIVLKTAHGAAGEGDGHDHRRRRRSADRTDHSLSRVRRQATTGATVDKKCYTRAELSAIFDLGNTLTVGQLTQLSPALLYQKLYAQCVTPESKKEEASPYKWLYGIVTVFVVCLCSLLGVMLVPCIRSTVYRLAMALFVGLAVGTLTGDAILHLIPSATGAHAHGEDDGHNHTEGPVVVDDYVWFSLVILAGMYGFYLLEAFFIRFWKAQGASGEGHGHSHDVELTVSADDKDLVDSKEEKSTEKNTGNMSLTVMIVLGDAVHNFADGLAIGAAFSSNTGVGIATGIAVFCHELPHELGDFAVLLKNGLTVWKAILWNVVSSLTAFLGLFISLAVATDERVQTWIFAVAAGMFLYIAMTDLLPQMTARDNCQDTPVFLLNNVGLLLGIFIMLLIAIFEERIIIT